MYIFDVKGINFEGRVHVLKLLGERKKDIFKLLKERGLFPLSVKFSSENFKYLTKIKKVSQNEIINFNRELYSLLKAGLPLLKSLYIIRSKVENPYFSIVLDEIISSVEKGEAFSESVKKFSDVFGILYSSILSSGEKSGNLPKVIFDYNEYLKKTQQMKKRIKRALIYPSFVFTFSLLVFTFIMVYIIPKFAKFYENFDASLPILTQFTIGVAKFMKNYILFFILLFIFLLFFINKLKKNSKFKIFYDKLKLKMPFGYLVKDFYISIYSRNISLMLEGGITILKSLNISLSSVKNSYLYKILLPVERDVLEGESLSSSFEKTGIFPSSYIEIVKVGESSGSLDRMLKEATEYLEERIETTVDSLISFLEPAIIITMGILIAGILLSVYMPIFSLVRVIH